MKQCSKCSRELPLTEFYGNPRSPDGHRSDCRECVLADRRARYETDGDLLRGRVLAAKRLAHTEVTVRGLRLILACVEEDIVGCADAIRAIVRDGDAPRTDVDRHLTSLAVALAKEWDKAPSRQIASAEAPEDLRLSLELVEALQAGEMVSVANTVEVMARSAETSGGNVADHLYFLARRVGAEWCDGLSRQYVAERLRKAIRQEEEAVSTG